MIKRILIFFICSTSVAYSQSSEEDILEIKGFEIIGQTFGQIHPSHRGKLKIKLTINYDSIPVEFLVIKNDFDEDLENISKEVLSKLRFYPPKGLKKDQVFVRVISLYFKNVYIGFNITQPKIDVYQ